MNYFSKTIALILVLIMLACNFTGCTLFLPVLGYELTGSKDARHNGFIYGALIDILTVLAYAAGVIVYFRFFVDSVETENNHLTEDNILIEKMNSLPEAERNSFIEKLNSLPEEKRASILNIIAFMPEKEIVSSSERVNALSDTEFASAARLFSSLSEAELDLVIDSLRERITPKPKINSVALADYPLFYAHTELGLQY